jgi:prepilin-type processing-associated H-X9-DG protein
LGQEHEWKPEAWNPAPSANFSKGDPNASLVDIDEDTDKSIGYIRYRHNEGANMVYADGHVKYARKGSQTQGTRALLASGVRRPGMV